MSTPSPEVLTWLEELIAIGTTSRGSNLPSVRPGQTRGPGVEPTPHALADVFRRRLGGDEHHRIMRHEKAAYDFSHGKLLSSYCLRPAEKTWPSAAAPRRAFM